MPRFCGCPAGMFIAYLLDDTLIIDVKLVDRQEFEDLCDTCPVGLEWIDTRYSDLVFDTFRFELQCR